MQQLKKGLKKKLIFFIIPLFFSHVNVKSIGIAAEAAGEGLRGTISNALNKAGIGIEKGLVEGIEKGITEQIGVKSFAELPISVRSAFENSLTETFQGLDKTAVKNMKINAPNVFKTAIEEAGSFKGFGKLEAEGLQNFLKQTKIEIPQIETKFPVKIAEPGELLSLNKEIGPLYKEGEIPLREARLGALQDLEYAQRIGNPELISRAESNFKIASENLEKFEMQLGQDIKVLKNEIDVIKHQMQTANPEERLNLTEKLTQTTENLRFSQIKQEVISQENALENFRSARNQLSQAEERVKNLEKELSAAKAETELPGTESELAQAEKVKKLETQLTSAKKQVQTLEEIHARAGLDLIGIGKMPVKDHAVFVKDRALINIKQKFIGAFELIVVGIVFSLGNYITGSIEQALGLKARADTLRKPQRFGDIWMQIPRGLLTGADKPAPDISYYVYVGIDANPQDRNVKRSNHADTDSYLQKAHVFIPSSKYEEWGRTAITDPRFPGTMVDANTGYQFVSGGQGVVGQEVVPFFAQGERGEASLQPKLNDLSGYIEHCVKGTAVIEYRIETSGCKGEPVIAKRFDEDENKAFVQKLYPEFAQTGQGWGSILNEAIEGLSRGTYYNNMLIRPFKALDAQTTKELGAQSSPLNKPYFALGINVYETSDSPNAKSARSVLQKDAQTKALADKIVEYVVMVDEENNIVPLQTPVRSGPYNFPSYQLNPRVRKMLSLFDGNFYQDGKVMPSNLDVEKILGNYFPTGRDQIMAMKQFVLEKLQYGPFIIGDVSLSIDKKVQDAGLPIYKLAKKLENGADDYVIATQGMEALILPGAPTNFVSLVTSRIYDGNLIPYDKVHGGKKDMAYTIYKQSDAQPPLVIVGGAQQDKYGTPISNALQAPLYSLFMESDLNPNTIDKKSISSSSDAQWLAGKLARIKNGVIQWPLPTPVQAQWALSDRGPTIKSASGDTQRIGQALQKMPALKSEIDQAYASWKKYILGKSAQDVERELGIFPWATTALRTINIRATSAQDIKNGNFIYTSAYYPGQYLVLSENKEGTQNIGRAFDPANPQPYLISLSTGNVYDKTTGEAVSKMSDITSLLNRVKQSQKTMSAELEKNIKSSQVGAGVGAVNEQFGPATQFGPFQFYLFKQDLDRGHYIYADVTSLQNPVELAQKGALLAQVKNFYVTIQLKDESGDGSDPSNWVFGKKLSAQTYMILNMNTGILYTRDGSYQGYFKPFSHSVDNNIDISKGYIDLIFEYLKTTWQEEGKPTEVRADLKARITQLTQSYYNLILKQKAEIEKAQQIEAQHNQPMDPNLIANIKAQPFIAHLEDFGRHVKKYGNKYYAVDPNGNLIVDLNVGDENKDNNMGVAYDTNGKQVFQLTGWALQAARAYNGIYVNTDGKQELDIIMDHPAIPLNSMIKLDVGEMQKRIAQARTSFNDTRAKYLKNTGDNVLQAQYVKAGVDLSIAQQLYKSAQAVQGITNISFYYNAALNMYFAYDSANQQYFDLNTGYEFNKDGSVRISQLPVLRSDQASHDIMFVGVDETGAFVASLQTKQGFMRLFLVEETPDATRPQSLIRYHMGSVPAGATSASTNTIGQEYYIYHDLDKATYELFSINDQQKPQKIGTFKADQTLKYSQLQYIQTDGTYVSADATQINPVYILGDSTFNTISYLFYKNNLIALSKQGEGYAGSYKQNGTTQAIALTRREIKHGAQVTGHYMSLKDGKSTYDFIFIPGLIDNSPIIACSDEKELLHLNNWKECTWQINEIVDAFAVNALVKALPKRLPAPPKTDIDRVMQQAGDRSAVAQANLDLIKYDDTFKRYVYQLSSRDTDWPYYDKSYEGWYVDLQSGILFNDKAPSQGAYPQATLLMSQLFILLDRLELAVAPVGRENNVPIYGLVYRSSSVVDREGKILNQQIYDLAKTQ